MVKNVPLFGLTRNLWEYIFDKSKIDAQKTWANFSAAEQKELIANLTDFRAKCVGKSAHKEEFVTCGGAKLEQVYSDSMESRIVPNLYMAGEFLDIDGVTGGYNLQAAWTTAEICAQSVAKKNM